MTRERHEVAVELVVVLAAIVGHSWIMCERLRWIKKIQVAEGEIILRPLKTLQAPAAAPPRKNLSGPPTKENPCFIRATNVSKFYVENHSVTLLD